MPGSRLTWAHLMAYSPASSGKLPNRSVIPFCTCEAGGPQGGWGHRLAARAKRAWLERDLCRCAGRRGGAAPRPSLIGSPPTCQAVTVDCHGARLVGQHEAGAVVRIQKEAPSAGGGDSQGAGQLRGKRRGRQRCGVRGTVGDRASVPRWRVGCRLECRHAQVQAASAGNECRRASCKMRVQAVLWKTASCTAGLPVDSPAQQSRLHLRLCPALCSWHRPPTASSRASAARSSWWVPAL